MTLSPTWIGIDVSKVWLDIASATGQRVQRIANTADVIAAFAQTLEGESTIVVLEATGIYDKTLRHELARAGIGHVRVNPRRARNFARVGGHLAKTDALDAAMLARMGRAQNLAADPLPAPEREELALLSRRRDQLVAMRAQEKGRRSEAGETSLVRDSLDETIAWLDAAIVRIETAIPRGSRPIPRSRPSRTWYVRCPGRGR
ncbi:IS110 family transposase [Paradevosia shaoguanensis]|uniref:IS110 family transposase n=1 Tax=Paradevosia shaoguanensis TaxID=1335043 RepID=UPI000A56F4F8|nr:transposase [Paradevosia shaoguanensis]